jgi:hypothetical protein
VDQLVEDLRATRGQTEWEAIAELLRVFDARAAWTDPTIRQWLDRPEQVNLEAARARLLETVVKHYDNRADTLRESHPLGIQVNLQTGVANGVLVVRSSEECASLVRRIVTKTWRFTLSEEGKGDTQYIVMREDISNSIFRVMTGDELLSNSFWNFYLKMPSEFYVDVVPRTNEREWLE